MQMNQDRDSLGLSAQSGLKTRSARPILPAPATSKPRAASRAYPAATPADSYGSPGRGSISRFRASRGRSGAGCIRNENIHKPENTPTNLHPQTRFDAHPIIKKSYPYICKRNKSRLWGAGYPPLFSLYLYKHCITNLPPTTYTTTLFNRNNLY